MNIVVLAGGLSTERDVSLSSGTMIAKALRTKGHNVVLLDVFMGYEKKVESIKQLFEENTNCINTANINKQIPDLKKIKESRLNKSDCYLGQNVVEICRYADISFLALHGGVGENGQLQATFDLLGIKYTGSGYLGSALAMDKGISKSIFRTNKVPVPYGETFTENDIKKGSINNWDCFPCVVKPCSGGSSVGVSIVNDKNEFLKAMESSLKFENDVVVEQYINGRELSIGVLGGKALPVIEIIPKCGFYDYVNKYQSGMTEEICPADLSTVITKDLQAEAVKAFNALHLEGYARIDFLLNEQNEIFCLEANTLPGMTPISLLPQEAKADGLEFPELCEKIIEISLEKYKG